MTLLAAEGFERTLARVMGVGLAGSLGSTTRYGYGNSWNHNGVSYGIQWDITPSDTVTIGGACINATYAVDTASGGFTFIADGGTLGHVRVYLSSATTLVAARGGIGSAGTSLATATVPTFLNTWRYIEAQVKISDTVGRVIVKVDGTTYIDFTGDTRNGGTSTNIDQVRQISLSNSNGFWDDTYVTDNLGSLNAGFLGEIRIYESQPNAAGSSTQFTPSSGANYAAVADLSDTTYVSSPTVGQRDTYNTVDLPSSPTSVLAVVVNSRMAKTDAGAASAKAAIKSSSTVAYGATRTLVAGATQFTDIFETNPATGAAWTAAAVNAMETGVEVA